jgi:hypothetical protein
MMDVKHPNGSEYKRCVLTNKFFNSSLKHIGKLIQIENNNYEFIFEK